MALERLRSVWEDRAGGLARRLPNLSPALVTWATLPLGLIAAWLIANADRSQTGAWMLFGAAASILGCQLLDGFDGLLARVHGKVTRWGDILDHTMDRVLDVIWIVALGYNAAWVGDPALGWAAAMLTMFGSYMGTQAQAVTGDRDYSGFSRADRLLITGVGLLMAAGMVWFSIVDPWTMPAPLSHLSVNPITVILLISGLGGAYTFTRRLYQARSRVAVLDREQPLSETSTNMAADETD